MWKPVSRIIVLGWAFGLLAAGNAQATFIESSRWHMGEGGSVVNGMPQDSVNTDGAFNNTNNGTAANTVQTISPPPVGSTAYLHVNGGWVSGTWIFAGGNPQALPTDNYGFEILARAASMPSGGYQWAPVMGLSDAAGGYQIALNDYAGQPHWGFVVDGVVWVSQSDSPVVTYGTWYDLAVVRSNGSTQFYVNGVPIGAAYEPNQTTDGWVNFGMQPRTGQPTFIGDLDEARIFTFGPGEFSVGYLYSIPEPSSLVLLGLGALRLVLRRRRRPMLNPRPR